MKLSCACRKRPRRRCVVHGLGLALPTPAQARRAEVAAFRAQLVELAAAEAACQACAAVRRGAVALGRPVIQPCKLHREVRARLARAG